jgi:putative FmdB family regulatory protein
MPTYEYACKDCSEHLEVVQSFKDDALTECPSCGGNLRKVFSAAGIIFKGSGWHVKDYASAANRSGGRDGASASDGDSGGTDGAAAKDASGDTGSSSPNKDGSKDGGTKSSDTKSSDTKSAGKEGASSSTSGSSSAATEKKSA